MAEPQIEPQFTAFFSKLARVTYFQTMLIEILRVRAFQRWGKCWWHFYARSENGLKIKQSELLWPERKNQFSISIIWRKPSLLILAVPQLSKSFLATKEKRSENGLKKVKVKSDQHSKSFQTENGLNFWAEAWKRSESFRPFFKVSEKVQSTFTSWR